MCVCVRVSVCVCVCEGKCPSYVTNWLEHKTYHYHTPNIGSVYIHTVDSLKQTTTIAPDLVQCWRYTPQSPIPPR